ncbi:hypothetical protein SAMN04488557_2348 [Hyphomicrobium facile]|uniref:Uncharacterized protein n=1 Tax=Hyphomicrobium facile TaxID=51670 RepID=A0A1I7NIP5_9HYPH|nr:hypothetical protein SAMN04488557_2348 [Hyphomicrobium facile]
MKVGEFAQRARAHRLRLKNSLTAGLEVSRVDRRVIDHEGANRTSAVKFHSQTKCRTETLIPYPKAAASQRG